MRISNLKKEKISEQILIFLYSTYPKPKFTFHIARELARDEEFIKKILINLKEKKLIIEIKKNSKGEQYKRRSRWILGEKAYQVYKESQKKDYPILS